MEIIRQGFRVEVVNQFGKLFSAFSNTKDGINNMVGDKLSELTMEEGIELSKGTQVNTYSAKKVGCLVLKGDLIESKRIA
ncbi:MAG: hypothetical protein QY322_03990 [bacterium]|nr:MAG: hypothetical protein QY322_03990 [bacterium]